MSDKFSTTISVSEFKAAIKERLNQLADKLDKHDRMRIAIKLKIGLVTVDRYMDKDRLEETRNLELAEQIIKEGEALLLKPGEILTH